MSSGKYHVGSGKFLLHFHWGSWRPRLKGASGGQKWIRLCIRSFIIRSAAMFFHRFTCGQSAMVVIPSRSCIQSKPLPSLHQKTNKQFLSFYVDSRILTLQAYDISTSTADAQWIHCGSTVDPQWIHCRSTVDPT